MYIISSLTYICISVYIYIHYVCNMYAHMYVYVPCPRACCLLACCPNHLQEGKAAAPTNRRISRASLRAEAAGGLN